MTTNANQITAARAVDAAIRERKIAASGRAQWISTYEANPAGAKTILASLVPLPAFINSPSDDYRTHATASAEDAELAALYAAVTGQPLEAARTEPRTVAASAAAARPAPRPVSITPPRPPVSASGYGEIAVQPGADAENEAFYQEVAWRLGGAVRGNMAPPASVTQIRGFEDPDAIRIEMNPDGTGRWVNPKRDRMDQQMREQSLVDQARKAAQVEADREKLKDMGML